MSKEFQRTYNDGLLFILQAVKIRLNLLNQIWEKVLYKQKVYLMDGMLYEVFFYCKWNFWMKDLLSYRSPLFQNHFSLFNQIIFFFENL